MAAPKTKTATNADHPLRARFDLRDVIDQSLILGEDFQRMFVTTLATFSQRHAASGAVQQSCCQRIFKDLDPLGDKCRRLPKRRRCSTKLPLWTISTSTCKSLAKGQLFSIVKYPQF